MRDDQTIWMGASHGLLAGANRRNGDMFLLNPFSGRIIDLPPYRGKPFLPKEESPFPMKLILSHSPSPSHIEEDCCALMILSSMDRVAVCRPTRSTEWAPVGGWYKPQFGREKTLYKEVAYWAARKSFVCVVKHQVERLVFWCHPGMEPVKTMLTPSNQGKYCSTYLVPEEESGKLFMVKRYVNDSNLLDYDVYRIDVDGNGGGVAKLCSTLHGLVMFVGINHSFAVKASNFPELKPNHIYFSGAWSSYNQSTDITNTHTPISHEVDAWSSNPSFQSTTDIFDYITNTHTPVFDSSPDEKPGFRSFSPWVVPTCCV
ncbi:hypothetical protein OROMI_010348 [Orobanche minor]